MKKRVIGVFLIVAIAISMFTPALAANKISETIQYYDSCTLADGSVLAVSTLGNGNVLVTLTKDNVLLESTEIDYAKKVLLFTDTSTRSRASHTKEIPFSSYMTYESQPSKGKPAAAKGSYTKFGQVSFRTQISTDYYSTPKADVSVRHNTPGDKIVQTVNVKGTHSLTTLISLFVSALAIVRPEITAVKGFLITLGLVAADGILTNTVDNVELEAIRYGENIKVTYNGDSKEYPEGARIVTTADIKKNGKHADKVFYDGLCEKRVRDCNLEYCSCIYNTFFTGYGTLRSMSFTDK